MRITGGAARGIPIRVGRGARTRPATDRMREAVFSSLGARVDGARFYDLFAGSGAYGLEAWSRGAATGVFVERDARAAAMLRQNLAAVARSCGRPSEAIEVVAADVLRWTPRAAGELADLIFADPPYEDISGLWRTLFEKFAAWLAPGGSIVFELPGEMEIDPAGWSCVKRIGKGRREPTCCIFLRS